MKCDTITIINNPNSGTHWKAIRDAMGIDYTPLRHGPAFFTDGLDFFSSV
jgi:hypothetical protein